jgi:hypothetical protein
VLGQFDRFCHFKSTSNEKFTPSTESTPNSRQEQGISTKFPPTTKSAPNLHLKIDFHTKSNVFTPNSKRSSSHSPELLLEGSAPCDSILIRNLSSAPLPANQVVLVLTYDAKLYPTNTSWNQIGTSIHERSKETSFRC